MRKNMISLLFIVVSCLLLISCNGGKSNEEIESELNQILADPWLGFDISYSEPRTHYSKLNSYSQASLVDFDRGISFGIELVKRKGSKEYSINSMWKKKIEGSLEEGWVTIEEYPKSFTYDPETGKVYIKDVGSSREPEERYSYIVTDHEPDRDLNLLRKKLESMKPKDALKLISVDN